MPRPSTKSLAQFNAEVGIRFQLYNSLFTSLPFHRIEKTGILLSLLSTICEEGYQKNQGPTQIINDFFSRHTSYNSEQEKNDLLFRIIQYIERQVVLFDALEDAAFGQVNDLNGFGTMKHLELEVTRTGKEEDLRAKLRDFGIRLVLTAHPTQFYPGPVLGIIHDLSKALAANDTTQINTLLQQLGKTPFFKKQKPTPYDEAISLVWYLENVFYPAAGRIVSSLGNRFPGVDNPGHPLIRLGFWPGGDRDGNPFVTEEITLKVAEALRGSIMKCYYLDVRRLKRRLTFQGVDLLLQELETKLYDNLFIPGHRSKLSGQEILQLLGQIREMIVEQHNGLFLHLVDNLIHKVELFGLHFATLDIRQDSSIHAEVLEEISEKEPELLPGWAEAGEEEKISLLCSVNRAAETSLLGSELYRDTLQSVAAMRTIQESNGEEGCNRYVISHCNSALNAMEVYGLFLLGGWKKEEMRVDIVPLFETIDDLQRAAGIMRQLYEHPVYRAHLQGRKNIQTIMLGFSDGTKDGGYLMANWSIYKAKQELTAVSRECGMDVIFFDGRGGPPSRGGGKTHRFYASLGPTIANREIQLTIQGQTVSSNFGTVDAAQYNIEQLIHAGISNDLFPGKHVRLGERDESLISDLAEAGRASYRALRDHPELTSYLLQVSPLRFYSETNIGSRPAKRGGGSAMTLKDLRAIPFVGSWSQLKQNVTGYYGVGSALQKMEEEGKMADLQELYQRSLFFKTLVDNCEMSMMKAYLPITANLATHPRFGEIWQMIYREYVLTRKYLTLLTGNEELMADYPVERLSVQMREKIVLPLVTIQQYALTRLREIEGRDPLKEVLEKLVMRCSFGIINAGRNSA